MFLCEKCGYGIKKYVYGKGRKCYICATQKERKVKSFIFGNEIIRGGFDKVIHPVPHEIKKSRGRPRKPKVDKLLIRGVNLRLRVKNSILRKKMALNRESVIK